MTASCAICPATAEDAEGWTGWILAEDIQWLSAFAHTGDMPITPAGRYDACPTCTAWIPRHRGGNMPAAVRDAIEALVTANPLHPTTARRLRAELIGQARHLASQLQPTNTDVRQQAQPRGPVMNPTSTRKRDAS